MKTTLTILTLLSALLLSSCGHVGYEVKRQKVIHAIWDGSRRVERPLEGADADTFTVLRPHRYAKDQHAVYHRQSVIKGANPSTFTLLSNWYAVDHAHVFYDGAILPDRDASTFERMNGYWTRDRHDVYFLNRAIQACDPTSFRVMFEQWAMDAQCTYVAEARVDGADQSSFHVLSEDYAQDKHHVYAWVGHSVPLTNSLPGEPRHLYKSIVRRIHAADLESFSPVEIPGCHYDARDQFRCYHSGKTAPCDCSE